MAFGTLKADTLTHSTAGSLATNYVVNGSAKAWLAYADHADTTKGSFAISSVTDSATTGVSTINLTNAMSDAFYVVTSQGGNAVIYEAANTGGSGSSGGFAGRTSSAFIIGSINVAETRTDSDNNIVVHGDLA
tara:strand:+ start:1613 stop:2011 length:399 start_codon:yes stop_codon:yes gene_type:complete